jgi:hypothetical protein
MGRDEYWNFGAGCPESYWREEIPSWLGDFIARLVSVSVCKAMNAVVL